MPSTHRQGNNDGPGSMRLSEYQRGAIFGLAIAGVPFCFVIGTAPWEIRAGATGAYWWQSSDVRTPKDAAGLYTLGLFVVGLGQAALFWWQLRLIRNGLADSAAASKAAQSSADTARLALEAAETPYLVPIVRAFDPKIDPAPPNARISPIGSFAFENCGRSPATILEIYYGPVLSREIPDPVPFPPPQTNLYHTRILAPGRETPKAFITAGQFGLEFPEDQSRSEWIVGQIRYADVFGNQFLTSFCSYRNRAHNVWNIVGTPAHNSRRKLAGAELAIANDRDRFPERL